MLHLCTEKKTGNERKSLWQVWTYDVLGTETDVYEVNALCKIASTHELTEHETLLNAGTDREFSTWEVSTADILAALQVSKLEDSDKELQIDVDGDDNVMYISLSRGNYPLGELIRVDSLGRVVQ